MITGTLDTQGIPPTTAIFPGYFTGERKAEMAAIAMESVPTGGDLRL
ncbi:MAG TPA: hypothetical protein VMW73_14610 [Spirochaetia bacterium]|nr:hypothetical protein [Spirochaetia bacterium]